MTTTAKAQQQAVATDTAAEILDPRWIAGHEAMKEWTEKFIRLNGRVGKVLEPATPGERAAARELTESLDTIKTPTSIDVPEEAGLRREHWGLNGKAQHAAENTWARFSAAFATWRDLFGGAYQQVTGNSTVTVWNLESQPITRQITPAAAEVVDTLRLHWEASVSSERQLRAELKRRMRDFAVAMEDPVIRPVVEAIAHLEGWQSDVRHQLTQVFRSLCRGKKLDVSSIAVIALYDTWLQLNGESPRVPRPRYDARARLQEKIEKIQAGVESE